MRASRSRKLYPDSGRITGNGNMSSNGIHPSSNGDGVAGPSANGAPLPTDPLDDATVFAQLIEVAERAGRADLVREFRLRAGGGTPADSDSPAQEAPPTP